MSGLPPLPQRTLPHAFARALTEVPEKEAFVDHERRSWTYREMSERSLAVAGGLAQLGVAEQEPVALMLDNSVELLHVVFGLGLTRRVQVPVNTAYKGTFLAHILEDSGAAVLVVEGHYAERLATVDGELSALRHVVVRGSCDEDAARALRARGWTVTPFDEVAGAATAEVVDASPGDLMAYMYTSGTTGVSKGVEVSHAQAYTYASREDSPQPRAHDRILVTLPMFHLAGQWYGAYQSVIARATCVVQPSFSVSKFWDWVRDEQITVTVMLGAIAELLQQADPHEDDRDNPLELAIMAPLASDIDRFQQRFGIQVGAVYGMSEIGAVMTSNHPDVVPGEAGLAREGYELRLVDENGDDVPLGVAGELLVRAEHPEMTMRGYHGLPEKTAETLRGGWVHTGDVFRRDEGGHYFFVDRAKDALRRRGENVSSFEVERVLNSYPDVYESAVVAVPSELGEDEIKAVLVLREGRELDPRALVDFLVERLPYFMVPRYFETAVELPRTPTQKVQKHLLRSADLGPQVWDREAEGIVLTRRS